MTRTITLPIRCSTVKRVNATIENIIKWELVVVILLFPISLIFDMWMMTIIPPYFYLMNADLNLSMWFAMRLLASFFIVLFGGIYLYEEYPLECIKDEGDEKE